MNYKKFNFLRLDLPSSAEERRTEIDALAEAYPNPTERLAFLYENLSILDSKASSLLAFNAIGLTALAVWLQYVPLNWMHFSLDIVFLLFLVSCGLCLAIVWVFWSPPNQFAAPALQTRVLLEKRDRRTLLYRSAWALASIAVVILLILSTLHTVGTFLYASGNCGEGCRTIYSEGGWGNRGINHQNSANPRPEHGGGQ